MSPDNLVAKAEININTTVDKVWNALTNEELLKKFMFGSTVISDWKEGSKIIWKGEWQGKAYEDKGEVLKAIPGKKLQYTHFSPMMGLPDIPENYHTVTIDLTENGEQTNVVLSQDKNTTEEAREHSQKNWAMMLEGLKKLLEESK
ncbi:MAG TPA: SRPBCC family protein [Chitinophagaceae bacterium]|nr:SRPBCC family protein [Chitinophagaceae bacterium]